METEVVEEEKSIDKAKNLVFFAAPYGVSLGCLYLWGYWDQFDINILQFAGVSDVVATALFPFLLGVIFLSVGMILGELYSDYTAMIIRRALPPPEKVTPFLRENSGRLMKMYVALCILMAFSPWSGKWPLLPVLISWPIAYYLVFSSGVRVPHAPDKFQLILVYLVVLFIPWSYVRGRSDADSIINGTSYSYVVSATAGQVIWTARPPELALRFVGHVGEYDFFYEPTTKSTSIAKVQKENLLTMRRLSPPPARSPLELLKDLWSNASSLIESMFSKRP